MKRFRKPQKFSPREGEKWICAKCGGEIDSLPFIPAKNPDGSLKRSVYHFECLPSKRENF